MSIHRSATEAGDLIGLNLDRLFDNSRKGIVVKVNEPSQEEKDWFNAFLDNRMITFGDGVLCETLFVRTGRGFSTGLNLDTGEYAFGSQRLEKGILFQARQLAGWNDPTGATPKKGNRMSMSG